MDDLLKKLRGPVGAGMTGESALAMADAADEIGRLRALVEFYEQGGKSLSEVKAERREARSDDESK